jgi:hypothetical protein
VLGIDQHDCHPQLTPIQPRRALLHQWRAELARHYTGTVGCLGDGEREIAKVTVATFEGAYRHMDRIGDRFGLLVVDEAHHFGVGVRDEALEMCAAPRRLALTATAPNGDALERLIVLMGPIVCELGIGDLAGSGWPTSKTWRWHFVSRRTCRRSTTPQYAFFAVFESFQGYASATSCDWPPAQGVSLAAASNFARSSRSCGRPAARLLRIRWSCDNSEIGMPA